MYVKIIKDNGEVIEKTLKGELRYILVETNDGDEFKMCDSIDRNTDVKDIDFSDLFDDQNKVEKKEYVDVSKLSSKEFNKMMKDIWD